MKGLDSFKLFLRGKTEFTVRTDCEASIKFAKQTNEKKVTRIRWLHFIDRILKENALADTLSRLENPVEELVKALHPNKFKHFADGTAIPRFAKQEQSTFSPQMMMSSSQNYFVRPEIKNQESFQYQDKISFRPELKRICFGEIDLCV